MAEQDIDIGKYGHGSLSLYQKNSLGLDTMSHKSGSSDSSLGTMVLWYYSTMVLCPTKVGLLLILHNTGGVVIMKKGVVIMKKGDRGAVVVILTWFLGPRWYHSSQHNCRLTPGDD